MLETICRSWPPHYLKKNLGDRPQGSPTDHWLLEIPFPGTQESPKHGRSGGPNLNPRCNVRALTYSLHFGLWRKWWNFKYKFYWDSTGNRFWQASGMYQNLVELSITPLCPSALSPIVGPIQLFCNVQDVSLLIKMTSLVLNGRRHLDEKREISNTTEQVHECGQLLPDKPWPAYTRTFTDICFILCSARFCLSGSQCVFFKLNSRQSLT